MGRKNTILKYYYYGRNGAYFITICTKDKKKILGDIVGATSGRPTQMVLSKYGQIVDNAILNIHNHYESIFVDKYVIMPNHVHMIVYFNELGGPGNPPLQNIVRDLKSFTTHKFGDILWQRSYYDHIIRNQQDYEDAWNYIDGNPSKWQDDELF